MYHSDNEFYFLNYEKRPKLFIYICLYIKIEEIPMFKIKASRFRITCLCETYVLNCMIQEVA
jgi:hypothetical protein